MKLKMYNVPFTSPAPATRTTTSPASPDHIPLGSNSVGADVNKAIAPEYPELSDPVSPDNVTLLPPPTSQSGSRVTVSLFDAYASGLL